MTRRRRRSIQLTDGSVVDVMVRDDRPLTDEDLRHLEASVIASRAKAAANAGAIGDITEWTDVPRAT